MNICEAPLDLLTVDLDRPRLLVHIEHFMLSVPAWSAASVSRAGRPHKAPSHPAGRPRTTWIHTVSSDTEADTLAMDRSSWRAVAN